MEIRQVDKTIDNTLKTKSTRGKISQRLFQSKLHNEKNRDAAINTSVSFKLEDEAEMIVQTQTVTGKIHEEQTESDVEISDYELADPSYISEEPTDYEKSQQTTKDKSI